MPVVVTAASCWCRARRHRCPAPCGGPLLVGHCDDLATPRPLGLLPDLSGSVGVDLTTALTSSADRETLLRALWAELDWPGHATVLAIEDVHWAR
jgi:hypothetical protein